MTFRVRDPSKPRRTLSPAQEAATQRSFRIFRLRGLWSQAWLLTGERRAAARDLIDQELALLGADAETKRQAEAAARWARIEAREAAEAAMEEELPF